MTTGPDDLIAGGIGQGAPTREIKYPKFNQRWGNIDADLAGRYENQANRQLASKKAVRLLLSPEHLAMGFARASNRLEKQKAEAVTIVQNRVDYVQMATRLNDLGNAYPNMGGDVAFALAMSGQDATSDASAAAASLGVQAATNTEVPDGVAQITPVNAYRFASANDTMSDADLLGNLIQRGFDPTQEIQGFIWTGDSFVTESDPDVPVGLRDVLKANADQYNENTGGVLSHVFGDAYGGLKWLSRGTFATVTAPWEAFSGAVRENVKDFSDGGDTEDLNWFQRIGAVGAAGIGLGWDESWDETTFAEASRQQWHGGGMNAGTGWFMGGSVAAIKEARDVAWYANQMDDGQPGTPGRVLASIVSDPGSIPYRIGSGVVDGVGALALDPTTYIAPGAVGAAARATPGIRAFVSARQALKWAGEDLTHVDVALSPNLVDEAATRLPDAPPPRQVGFPKDPEQLPRAADQATEVNYLAPNWWTGGTQHDPALLSILRGRKVGAERSVRLRSRRNLKGQREPVRFALDTDGMTGYVDTTPSTGWATEAKAGYTTNLVPNTTLEDLSARVKQIDLAEQVDASSPMGELLSDLMVNKGWNRVTRNIPVKDKTTGETIRFDQTNSFYRPDQMLPEGAERVSPFTQRVDTATGAIELGVNPGAEGLSAPLGNWASSVSADLSPGTFLTHFDEVGQLRTRELFDRTPLAGVTDPNLLDEIPADGGVRVLYAADRLTGGVDTKAGVEQTRQAVYREEPLAAWPSQRDPGEFDEAKWLKDTEDSANRWSNNPKAIGARRSERVATLREPWDNAEEVSGLGLSKADWARYADTGEIPVEAFINASDNPAVLGGILDNGISEYAFSERQLDLHNDVAFFDFLSRYGISRQMWEEGRATGHVSIPKKPDMTTRAQPKEVWVGRTVDDEGNIVNPGYKRTLTKVARKGANKKQYFRLEGQADAGTDTIKAELYAEAAPTDEALEAARAEHAARRAAAAADLPGPQVYAAEVADAATKHGKGTAAAPAFRLFPSARTAVVGNSAPIDDIQGLRSVAVEFKPNRKPRIADLSDPDTFDTYLGPALAERLDSAALESAQHGGTDAVNAAIDAVEEAIRVKDGAKAIRAWEDLNRLLPEAQGVGSLRASAAVDQLKDLFVDGGYDAVKWKNGSDEVFELLSETQWRTRPVKKVKTAERVKTVKDSWDEHRFGVVFSGDQSNLYQQMRGIDVPAVKPQNWTHEQWAAWTQQKERLLARGWVLEDTPHGREVLRRPMAGEYDAKAAKELDDAMIAGEMDDPVHAGAGLMESGTRKMVVPTKFYEWLTDPKRIPYYERIAGTDDPEDILKLTGKQDVGLLGNLVRASTPDEVRNAFIEGAGLQKIKVLKTQGAAAEKIEGAVDNVLQHLPGFPKSVDDVRLTRAMPGQYIPLGNPDQAFHDLLNYMIAARVPRAQRKELLNSMLEQGTAYGRKEVVFQTFKVIESVLKEHLARSWTKHAKDPAEVDAVARRLTQLFQKDHLEQINYHTKDPETLGTIPGRVLSDNDIATHSPQMLGDFLDEVMPLPSVRDIKRVTSAIGRMRGAGMDLSRTHAIDGIIKALDGYNTLFKVTALARIAYPVRVLLEEQGRMWGAGFSNIYTHPIHYMLNVTKGNRSRDLAGNVFRDLGTDPDPNAYASALVNSRLMLDDDTSMKFLGRTYAVVDETAPTEYLRGWMFGLGKMHADPVARRIVGGFTRDELAKMPQEVADADSLTKVSWWMTHHDKGKEYLTSLREASFNTLPEFSASLRTGDGVRAFVQDITDQVTYLTAQNDPALVEVIRHGKLTANDVTERLFRDPTQGTGGQVWNEGGPNSGFVGVLRNYTRLDAKPKTVVTPTGIVSNADLTAWNKATTLMFSWLNTRPTNYLSRSPVFREHYWDRVAEYLPLATDDALERITASLDQAVLSHKQKKLFAKAIKHRKSENATLDFADVDSLAKNDALEVVKDLLYDTSDKSNLWDGMRLAAPFGAAWAEVMKTWTKIILNNPRVLDRVAHGIHGAQQEGSNVIYDATGTQHQADQGFFFKDLTTGDESFAWPMPAQAQRFLTWGINDQNPEALFPAPVSGLNLIGQVQPGFGPLVTAPVQAVLGGRGDDWSEDVLNFIAPFGGPSPESSGGLGNALIDSVTPAFMRKLLTSVYPVTPEQKSQLASANLSSQVYLASTGRYDLSSADERTRLEQDAQSMARRLFFLRGIAQFVLPTIGSPDQAAMTGNGELVIQAKLAEVLRGYQSDPGEGGYGYQQGFLRFLRDYGSELYLMGVDKTDSTGYMAPTRNTYQWMRKNPDLMAKYPAVWGLLVDDPGTDFYYPAYQAQTRLGYRTLLSPEDLVTQANARMGRALYYSYRDQVGDNPTEAQSLELRQLQDTLELRFPGYNRVPDSLGTTNQSLLQLEEASRDKAVQATPIGGALAQYFAARKRIRDQGISSLRTGQGRELAPELYYLGQQLAATTPGFRLAWDRLLSYEFDPEQFETTTEEAVA